MYSNQKVCAPQSCCARRVKPLSNQIQQTQQSIINSGPKLILYSLTFSVKTCGKPHIQNIMSNVTAKPGQMASFKCQVDMSCIVAYIEWYHEMDNGTEKLIKVGILFRLSLFRNSYRNEQLKYLCNCQGSFWK